jgi:hypothetical protein
VGSPLFVHDLLRRRRVVPDRRQVRTRPPVRQCTQAPHPRCRRCRDRKTVVALAFPRRTELTLSEEEVSDVSLATFYVFDKETAVLPRPSAR